MRRRRTYVHGKRLQKGSTHSSSALQQRRTDRRRHTRETTDTGAKTYENRQWRSSAIFVFSWHVVGSVSGDCYITRQHACSDLRCLRFPVIYTTRNIHKDRQLRHGGIRFHIKKLGGNVLSPVIATSPDRTMALSFDVLSVSSVTHTRPKRTREHRHWRHSGIIQYKLIGNHQRFVVCGVLLHHSITRWSGT